MDFIVLSPGINLIKNKNLSKFKKKIITDIDLFYINNNKSKSMLGKLNNLDSAGSRLSNLLGGGI